MSTVLPQRAHIRNIGRVSVRLVPGAKDARILIAQQEKRSGNKGKLEVKPREIWGSIIHSFGSRWACLTGCKGETSLSRLRLRNENTPVSGRYFSTSRIDRVFTIFPHTTAIMYLITFLEAKKLQLYSHKHLRNETILNRSNVQSINVKRARYHDILWTFHRKSSASASLKLSNNLVGSKQDSFIDTN